MKVSKHFIRSEFACHCGCGYATADVKLVELLELIRHYFKKPVRITSACRCESHNKKVGGSDNSYHKLGLAADIQVRDVPPGEVQDFIDNTLNHQGGMGRYEIFTHVDVRGTKARW